MPPYGDGKVATDYCTHCDGTPAIFDCPHCSELVCGRCYHMTCPKNRRATERKPERLRLHRVSLALHQQDIDRIAEEARKAGVDPSRWMRRVLKERLDDICWGKA